MAGKRRTVGAVVYVRIDVHSLPISGIFDSVSVSPDVIICLEEMNFVIAVFVQQLTQCKSTHAPIKSSEASSSRDTPHHSPMLLPDQTPPTQRLRPSSSFVMLDLARWISMDGPNTEFRQPKSISIDQADPDVGCQPVGAAAIEWSRIVT